MVTVFRGVSVTNRLNIKHHLQVLMGAIVNRGPYSLDITLSLFRVVISQNWTVNSFGVELSMPSSLSFSLVSLLSRMISTTWRHVRRILSRVFFFSFIYNFILFQHCFRDSVCVTRTCSRNGHPKSTSTATVVVVVVVVVVIVVIA
jgi:hypothetical protein